MANGVAYEDDLEDGSVLFNLGLDTSLYLLNDWDNIDIYDSLVNSPAYFEGPSFIRDNLSGLESLVFGNITHEILLDGQYAVLIYNDAENVEYLLINSNSISLYDNHKMISTLNIVSGTYDLVVTNNGKISINGNYLGKTSDVNSAIRFISLFN